MAKPCRKCGTYASNATKVCSICGRSFDKLTLRLNDNFIERFHKDLDNTKTELRKMGVIPMTESEFDYRLQRVKKDVFTKSQGELITCPITGNQSMAKKGDYIVTTEAGHVYPMKPDQFDQMYIKGK